MEIFKLHKMPKKASDSLFQHGVRRLQPYGRKSGQLVLNANSDDFRKKVTVISTCLRCNSAIKVGGDKSQALKDAQFHYSECYFKQRVFHLHFPPTHSEEESVRQYRCPRPGCTQRRMDYRGWSLHQAIAHKVLGDMMARDPTPGMREVLALLYPNKEYRAIPLPSDPGPVSCKMEDLPKHDNIIQKIVMVDVKNVLNTKVSKTSDVTDVASRPEDSDNSSLILSVDKVHNCLICGGKSKEGRNLNLSDKLNEVKYHYSVCYYTEGGFHDLVDAGPLNQGDKAEDVGSQFKYKCPFDSCSKSVSGRGGTKMLMGYKAYVIHVAVVHHQLEAAMSRDGRPGIGEVRAAIIQARREEGGLFETMPPVLFEEVHDCLLCKGDKKDGKNLSFNPEKILTLRYHYASCYYERDIYLEKYPLEPDNKDTNGKPIDHLGRDFKYTCEEKKCNNRRRKMGYKEWCIHRASDHGGLIEIMSHDDNEAIRNVGKRLESYRY